MHEKEKYSGDFYFLIGDNTNASGFLLNVDVPHTSLSDTSSKLNFKDLSGSLFLTPKSLSWVHTQRYYSSSIPYIPVLSNETESFCVFERTPSSVSTTTTLYRIHGRCWELAGDPFPYFESVLHSRYISF